MKSIDLGFLEDENGNIKLNNRYLNFSDFPSVMVNLDNLGNLRATEGQIVYNNKTNVLAIRVGNDWKVTKCINQWVKTSGTTDERPSYIALYVGFMFFDTTLNMPIWWNGSKWINVLGFTPSLTKGTTELRPVFNIGENEGFEYYDTTLKKKILWNGTAWVNMDGTQLS